MKRRKRIIIVDFGGIGDLVLAIPFLRGLKQAFPSAEVSMLCAERTGMILTEQSFITSLYLSPITLRGLFIIGLKLRKKRFDMAINLMPETSYFSSIKMYLFFLLINAKKWLGRNTEGRGFFYHIKVPERKMQMENEVLFYGKILKTISTDGRAFDDKLEFYISKANRKRAGELLSKERQFPQNPLVLINPGSDRPAKRWPVERYAEMVKILKNLFPSIEFGVIGTNRELSLGRIIKEQAGPGVFVLSGRIPLKTLPAVLDKASLLITNDSGPAHLARALGTPVVVLAGPSEPAYVTVQGRNESVVIQHLIPCAPCSRRSCNTMECWKAISVQEAVVVTSKFLKK